PEPLKVILTSPHTSCTRCPPTTRFRSLRLRTKTQNTRVLDASFFWRKGVLLVGHCPSCGADHYPDRITYRGVQGERLQRLEYQATYLRISKHGLWVDRRVALGQENAVREFRAGWSNFAKWISAMTRDGPAMTYRQSRRLFIEHFGRRLLLAHGHSASFACPANLDSSMFAEHIRDMIGKDGGTLARSLQHGCMDCTHHKRYHTDLLDEGAVLDDDPESAGLAGAIDLPNSPEDDDGLAHQETPAGLPRRPPRQEGPPPNAPRGYVRMAVMDGKVVGHRICAVDDCTAPLFNFKNGRFCREHLELLRDKCGIIPCGRLRRAGNALTCDNPAHSQWEDAWANRFQRISYPTIRRVIRERRQADGNEAFHLQLPPLGDIPGNQVVHTFRARTVYCIETVQWSCGMPIGWGKCYKSESTPQVLSIMNRIWEDNFDLRPSFLCYDDACDLLRHIVTQNVEDPWLKSTKFIVDAFHYVNHRATDVLCRLWCNPAPTNGSQPDLVLVERDQQGRTHQTRAFNTETAEQLNAWLQGYEAPLRNMTDVNFDLFVHALFLLFAEDVQARIERKDRALGEEFWENMQEGGE
ncbi:uncharacterized protein PHACADRAFT_107890, partial [Phanerochaete carnosa HHB-10118-sp]